MTAFADLPRYRSHKIVQGAPILAIDMSAPGVEAMVALDIGGGVRKAASVPKSVFARGTPARGDYLVVYDDGYVSWSPKKAFEEGYARLGA